MNLVISNITVGKPLNKSGSKEYLFEQKIIALHLCCEHSQNIQTYILLYLLHLHNLAHQFFST